MTDETTVRWLIALVRAFTPKVVPLDVEPDGSYDESTTRWGMNAVYEAVPAHIREAAESALPDDTRRHFAQLRNEAQPCRP